MSSRKPRKDSVWAPHTTKTLFDDTIDDDDRRKQWQRSLQAQEDEQELLHRTVVASKRQHLELQYERVAKQRAFIRRERRKLLLQHALLASERERFDASRSSDWFCLEAFPAATDRRVTVDVGGEMFELSAAVALKDPTSLLAAFVQDNSPLTAVESGCFRVDRDWRLFRHILKFLRDGILPSDMKLLRDLYTESEFWRFETLLKAIEVKNLQVWQLTQNDNGKAAVKTISATDKELREWWLNPPTWWGASDDVGTKTKEEKTKKSCKKKKSSTSASAKVNTKKGDKGGDGDKEAWWKNSSSNGSRALA